MLTFYSDELAELILIRHTLMYAFIYFRGGPGNSFRAGFENTDASLISSGIQADCLIKPPENSDFVFIDILNLYTVVSFPFEIIPVFWKFSTNPMS